MNPQFSGGANYGFSCNDRKEGGNISLISQVQVHQSFPCSYMPNTIFNLINSLLYTY